MPEERKYNLRIYVQIYEETGVEGSLNIMEEVKSIRSKSFLEIVGILVKFHELSEAILDKEV